DDRKSATAPSSAPRRSSCVFAACLTSIGVTHPATRISVPSAMTVITRLDSRRMSRPPIVVEKRLWRQLVAKEILLAPDLSVDNSGDGERQRIRRSPRSDPALHNAER